MCCLGLAAQPGVKAEGDPKPGVIAVVLGREITAERKFDLQGLVFRALLDKYAANYGLEATEEEVTTFVRETAEKEKRLYARFEREREGLRRELASPELDEAARKAKQSRLQSLDTILKSSREQEERARNMGPAMEEARRRMGRHFVRMWKVNRALHARYGGRVIFQQAGIEPVDAYREFLREQEKEGAFRILDPACEGDFWRYFTDDSMHTFYRGDDAPKLLETPWWLMQEPAEDKSGAAVP